MLRIPGFFYYFFSFEYFLIYICRIYLLSSGLMGFTPSAASAALQFFSITMETASISSSAAAAHSAPLPRTSTGRFLFNAFRIFFSSSGITSRRGPISCAKSSRYGFNVSLIYIYLITTGLVFHILSAGPV